MILFGILIGFIAGSLTAIIVLKTAIKHRSEVNFISLNKDEQKQTTEVFNKTEIAHPKRLLASLIVAFLLIIFGLIIAIR